MDSQSGGEQKRVEAFMRLAMVWLLVRVEVEMFYVRAWWRHDGFDNCEVRVKLLLLIWSCRYTPSLAKWFLSKGNTSWLWDRAHYGSIPLVGAEGGGWDRDGVGRAKGACAEGEGSHVGDTLQRLKAMEWFCYCNSENQKVGRIEMFGCFEGRKYII